MTKINLPNLDEDFNYDVEQDVNIDPEQLDVECVKQPVIFNHYCQAFAVAENQMDNAKLEKEKTENELAFKIRNNSEEFGLNKSTDKAVESAVIIQPEYTEAIEKYNQAKYEYNIMKGIVRALDQKNSRLDGLIRLHAQSYFAGPEIPENLSDKFQQQREEKRERARNKMAEKARQRAEERAL